MTEEQSGFVGAGMRLQARLYDEQETVYNLLKVIESLQDKISILKSALARDITLCPHCEGGLEPQPNLPNAKGSDTFFEMQCPYCGSRLDVIYDDILTYTLTVKKAAVSPDCHPCAKR